MFTPLNARLSVHHFMKLKIAKNVCAFSIPNISEWVKNCRKYGKHSLRSVIKIRHSHDQLIRNSQTEPPNSISGRFSIADVMHIGQEMLQLVHKCSCALKQSRFSRNSRWRDGIWKSTVVRNFMNCDGGFSCWQADSSSLQEGSAVDRLIAAVCRRVQLLTGW